MIPRKQCHPDTIGLTHMEVKETVAVYVGPSQVQGL